MEHVFVHADDAARARAVITSTRRGATHWVLVPCPPRMTQRSGQLASRAARERWRRHWADRLLADVRPLAAAAGDLVSLALPAAVPQLAAQVRAAHGTVRFVDGRRRPDASSPGAMLPGCSSSWSSGC